MKVSIIIPIYKVEAYIKRCIESVCNQTYSNLEVILVNDATPDCSIEVANSVIENSSRSDIFKIINHDQNKGLSGARNTGIEHSTGDYIFFIDSDDELEDNDSIELLANCLMENNADVAIGNYRGIKDEGSYISKYNKKALYSDGSLIEAFVSGDIPVTAWNKLISRKLFNEGLQFKEDILNEDELFSYQMLFMNPTVVMLGDVTYKYYIRQGSIMTSFNENRLISPVVVHEEAVKSYKEIGGDNELLLKSLDHFAFKRHVNIIQSVVSDELKVKLYNRLSASQRSIKGVGVMRYVYNLHIFMPSFIGYRVMKLIAKRYAKTRNLS